MLPIGVWSFEVAYWLGKAWVTALWAILLLPTELRRQQIDSSRSSHISTHISTHKECYASHRLSSSHGCAKDLAAVILPLGRLQRLRTSHDNSQNRLR
jgi:hypothetical protein